MAQTCQYGLASWGHGILPTGRVMCGIPLTEGKQAGDQRQPTGLQKQIRQGEGELGVPVT